MRFNLNNRVFWLSLVCAAALTACGGGGGGAADGSADAGNGGSPGTGGSTQTPGTPGTPAELNTAEYIGTWTGDTAVCLSSFPYGNYHYRLTTLVLAEKTAEVMNTAYNDAACTSKAGRVIERYNVSWSAGSVPNKRSIRPFIHGHPGTVR